MVIVHGPAGFGKTTLLAQVAGHRKETGDVIVWLTIDQQDRNPQILLDHLALGCRLAGLPLPDRSLSVLDLCESLPTDACVTFVLDELEHIADAESIVVLRDFCLESHSNIQLIIGTREVPLAHMTQLYISGVVDLIEPTEVQFQDDEAYALLGGSVAAEDVPEVVELAEGWAIVLQLAKIHASKTGGTGGIIPELRATRKQTFQYLLEQIFERLSGDQAQLLQECSILTYVDAGAANAVGQRDNAHGLLRSLSDLDPIIMMTSDEPVVFRFHPLFREFLTEVQQRKGADSTAALHRRAAHFYFGQHMLADAVRHAVASEDLSLASNYLEKAGGIACVFDIGPPVLGNLLDHFTDEWLESRPILGAARAVLRAVEGRTAHALSIFSRIFGTPLDQFDLASDEDDELVIIKNLARAFVLMSTDLQVPLKSAYFSALDILNAVIQRNYPNDSRYRALLLALRVIMDQRYEDVESAANRLTQYKKLCEVEGFAPRLPSITPQMGMIAFASGDFDSAIEYLAGEKGDVAQQFGKREEQLRRVSSALLARIYYEKDDLDRARQNLVPAEDDIPFTFAEIVMNMFAIRALCWIGLGHGNRAIGFLDHSIGQAQVSGYKQLSSSLLAVKIESLIRMGQQAEAISISKESSFGSMWGQGFDDSPWAWILAEPVARATVQVLVCEGELAKASEVACEFTHRARAQGRQHMECVGKVLEAIVFEAAGDGDRATLELRCALKLAAELGLVRPFLDLDAVILPAFRHCAKEAESQTVAEHVATILAAVGRTLRQSDKVSDLTSREMDVLCELAHGDGRKWVAKRLGISPETVKHHTKRLYTKLNASNTAEALINAWHAAHFRAE